MKVYELIQDAVEKFQNAGIMEAQQDAQILLDYVYHIKPSDYFFRKTEEISEEDEKYREFWRCVNQRCARMPVQYITGSWCFMGLEFQVNEQVLIPRFDTEILVEEALKRGRPDRKEEEQGWRLLDMCTGSGCIGISLKYFWKEMTGRKQECHMTAVDVSKGALMMAAENSRHLGLDIRFVESDLFTALKPSEQYDMIVSNPPYIPSREIPELMPEVSKYEPLMALDGSEDGMKFYRAITKEAPQYLKAGGWLLYEIGCEQGAAVRELLQEAGFTEIEIIKDLSGLDRVATGRWSSFRKKPGES